MKLDRNINKNGRGKYALINRRKLSDSQNDCLDLAAGHPELCATIQGHAIETGSESDYFVIKFTDRFAEEALRAYASEVRAQARSAMNTSLARHEWMEYADEVQDLAERARELKRGGMSKLPD